MRRENEEARVERDKMWLPRSTNPPRLFDCFLLFNATYAVSELNFTCATANNISSANIRKHNKLVFGILGAHKQTVSDLGGVGRAARYLDVGAALVVSMIRSRACDMALIVRIYQLVRTLPLLETWWGRLMP